MPYLVLREHLFGKLSVFTLEVPVARRLAAKIEKMKKRLWLMNLLRLILLTQRNRQMVFIPSAALYLDEYCGSNISPYFKHTALRAETG